MPAVIFPAGPTDHCFQCNHPGDTSPLQQCARCHVARYCSHNCQRANWPVHRILCLSHDQLLSVDSRKTINSVKVFVRWLNCWRDALLSWATLAANLANKSEDYLVSHCFVIHVKKRDTKTRKHIRSMFTPTVGGMYEDSQVLQMVNAISDLDFRSQALDTFNLVVPRKDVIRVTVISDTLHSSTGDTLGRLFAAGHCARFMDSTKLSARVVSSALETAWEELFEDGTVFVSVDVTAQTSVRIPSRENSLYLIKSRSWLCGLPIELVVEILFFACGSFFEAAGTFVEDRASFMLVCRGWYHIICGCGRFWSSFSIVARMPACDFDLWAERVGNSSIDLRLYLDILHLHPPAPDVVSMEDITGYLLPHISQCVDLQLHAEDIISLPSVLDVMARSDLLRTRSLSIKRFRVSSDCSPESTRPVPHIFPRVSPPLRRLRLSDFVFSWSDLCRFVGLTDLVLHKLLDELAPAALQFAALIEHLPSLARLSLRSVGCTETAAHTISVEHPTLSVLDVCFDGQTGMSVMLARCRFPSLATFSIVFATALDTDLLYACRSILAPISTFVASGSTSGSVGLYTIYDSMPRVESVDISGGGRCMFLPFLSDRPNSRLCPLLVDLRLKGVNRIHSLHAHYAYDRVHPAADVDYLVSQINSFRIDPIFRYPVDWAFY
ncbi:hypothetical protein DFH06DRAFT_1151689 [Mycena polygramma]|nr:hypothetical protein DFH06DRAFT_1151689 [Mycena polygramma]